MTVNARGLLAHQDTAYEEWGFSGALTVTPSADGRGLSMRLGSGWGATHSGVESLWSRQNAAGRRCCMVRPRNHATTPCRATTEHLAVRAKRSASTVRTHQRTLIARSLIETDTRKGGRESTRWRVMLPAEGNSDHRAGQQKLLGRPTETVAEGREGIEGTSEKSTYVRTNGRKNRRTNRPFVQTILLSFPPQKRWLTASSLARP